MTDTTQDELGQSGISRRRALQAGVGAGIGVVAWSGATITSMGGTPAYAAACTFAVNVFIANDRNTSQGCAKGVAGSLEWHPLDLNLLPANYTIVPQVTSPKICNNTGRWNMTFTFPASMTCDVRVVLHNPNSFNTPTAVWDFVGTSPLPLYLPSAADVNAAAPSLPSQTRYSVRVQCITTGKEDCFNLP